EAGRTQTSGLRSRSASWHAPLRLGTSAQGVPAVATCESFSLGTMQRASRLKRELSLLATEPPPGITCWQDADRMDDLRAQILGETNTPYEKGVFKLEVNIPERSV
ncbi:Ubiquitin-conjugating enzyme E2 T, partial [Camelus dromedarius]